MTLVPIHSQDHDRNMLKQLSELLPVILFFAVYQLDGNTMYFAGYEYHFDGIFSATQVLMIATAIQIGCARLFGGRLEKRQLLLLGAVMIFGAATLLFRNQMFIQWKPTVFNWVLALACLISPRIDGKTLLERILASQLQLPAAAWARLNLLWIANFVIVGILNLVVAYQFSESFWVSYKLYSSSGFTLLLMILTMIVIAPYIKDAEFEQDNS